jgi:hypothetical protein
VQWTRLGGPGATEGLGDADPEGLAIAAKVGLAVTPPDDPEPQAEAMSRTRIPVRPSCTG